MKYIIKNCFYSNCTCTHNKMLCANDNECLLRRIVELCKNARNERNLAFLKKNFTGADISKLYGKADLATEILELLKIEECENE